MVTADLFFRISGLALLLGGLLGTAGWLLFILLDPGHQDYSSDRWLPLNFLIIAAGVFMAMGLPGFYASQAVESGILGLIGFALLFIGIVVPNIAVQAVETVTMPNIPAHMMKLVAVGAPSAFIGTILTGAATWRAGVYPPLAGIGLILAALIGLLTVVPGVPTWLGRGSIVAAVFTGVMASLGYLMLSQ